MNEWLRNTARSYLALSYIWTRLFPVPLPDRFRKVICSDSMTVGSGLMARPHVDLCESGSFAVGAAVEAPTTSHPQGSGSQLVIGWSKSNNTAYSNSLFVLWHRGVYPAPQRHGSLLWAVARSRSGGQGTAARSHPHCCPLNTLGERKAGTILSHERAVHLERAAGVFWLAVFFVRLTFPYHLLKTILPSVYLHSYKCFYANRHGAALLHRHRLRTFCTETHKSKSVNIPVLHISREAIFFPLGVTTL